MRKIPCTVFLSLLFFCVQHAAAQQPELVIPSGHMFQVKGAIYSKNEKYIITWSDNIKIWEAATGKLIKNIEHATKYPDEVMLLNDNQTLVAAYPDSVIFRNINEDRVIRSFAGNNFRINEKSNAFILMQYDEDNIRTRGARLYDLRSFQRIKSFKEPIAAASDDKTYISVDISALKVYDSSFNIIYSSEKGYMVGVSEDFSLIAMQYDSTLDIIDVRKQQVLHTIHTGRTNEYNIRFFVKQNTALVKVTPNDLDRDYVAQSGDAYFYSIDLTHFAVKHRFPEQKGNLDAWDSEGTMLAASFTDSTIRTWDIETGKLIAEIKDADGVSKELYISQSKKYLLASSNASSAKAWDIQQKKLHLRLADNTSYLQKISFAGSDKYVLAQREEDVWVWDIEKGKPLFTQATAKDRRTWDWFVSTDERTLYRITKKYYQTRLGKGNSFYLETDSSFFRLAAYDLRTGTLLKDLALPEGVFRQAFSPDGKYLLLGVSDSSLQVVDLATGKIILRKKLNATPDNISFVGNGSQFVIVTDNHFTLYDSKTFTPLYGFEEANSLSTYGYDVNSGIAVLALNDKTLIVRDVKQNKLLFQYDATRSNTNNVFDKETYRVVFDQTGRYAYVKSLVDSLIVGIDLQTGATQKSIRLQTYAADISINNRNNLLIAANDYLVEWSVTGDSVIQSQQYGVDDINDVQASGKLVIGHVGSELRIFDRKNAKLMHCVYFLPAGNYIVADADKRFDGTDAARKQLYFSCGTEIIELAQVKDQLWVPNLAERIIKAEKINAPAISQLGICGLTPLVESKETNDAFLFTIRPRTGGLGETVLYVNGIEVKRYRVNEISSSGETYQLTVAKSSLQSLLASGKENAVLVKAFTKNNDIASRGISLNLATQAKSQSPPNLFAVMVGVSDYKGSAMDLKYAAKDAQDLSNALSAAAKKLLNSDGKEHVFMYNINTSANRTAFPEKQAIKNVFEEISKRSMPNDILMVFFAGHGVMAGEQKQFYFLTAEASENSDVTATGISISELNEWMKPSRIKAQKRVLVFDACNSGQAINDIITIGNKDDKYVAARNDDESNRVKAVEKLNERSGMFILSASASNQVAYELGKYSQGVLTYSLLKVIREQPDILDDGKYLNVDRWFAASEKMVTELISQTGNRQNPQKFGTGGFNVGLVDKDVIAKINLPNERPLFTASNFQNSDETVAYDDIELSKLVNQQLNEIAVRGVDSKVSYVTGSNSPDAYTLSGRYDIKGDEITVRVNIVQQKKAVHRFEVKGKSSALNALAAAIVANVESWIK